MIKSILSKNIIKSYGNENYTKNHLSSDVSLTGNDNPKQTLKLLACDSTLPALPSHGVGLFDYSQTWH